MNILVIHGPNLNFLGQREPAVYGSLTLKQLDARIKEYAAAKKAKVRVFQSNCEGRIIDLIAANMAWADWLIINPAAYTHYSYAIRDAIKASGLPAVEVHLSDTAAREPFRRLSVTKTVCLKQIKGLGHNSYLKAVDFALKNDKK
ncbi:MAG: 3-dehydroquinate dehydratase [Elusimicrobia bacterium RIFOXYA2_FULL_53_38]|nr:MAG: 3-dehydroquinate dehydratase [Elusimicrobia bacterium RIFOXYA2_FULL_53_38]